MWSGEFGRTPRFLPSLRDASIGQCFSAILAGCGIRGGAVYGKSDKVGAAPESNPVHPQDIHATVLHAMGIPLDPATENSGVARPLTSGKPLYDLFG